MEAKKTLISWITYEYAYNPKTNEWYAAVGILTFGFIVVSYLLNNFLFGVLIILSGFSIALYGARHPKKVSFGLTARGILIGSRLYPYSTLKSFWLEYEPPHKKELIIISKKVSVPRIVIPLEDADPNKIREILIKLLPEKHDEESLTDVLIRMTGF